MSNLIQINMKIAEALYSAGKAVYLLPSKVEASSPHFDPFPMAPNDGTGGEFEGRVRDFTRYICSPEYGIRPSFYVNGRLRTIKSTRTARRKGGYHEND